MERNLASAESLPAAEVPERLDALATSCSIADDVMQAFWDAMRHWAEFKPGQPQWPNSYWAVWPDDEIAEQVVHSTRQLYCELMTTSRFSVAGFAGDVAALMAEVYVQPPLRVRHAVAVAALVCISEAVDALEQSESEVDASEQLHAAEQWLAQCEHLRSVEIDVERALQAGLSQGIEGEKQKASTRAKANAQGMRLPAGVDQERVASFITQAQAEPGAKYDTVIAALVKQWPASEGAWRERYTKLLNAGTIKSLRRR